MSTASIRLSLIVAVAFSVAALTWAAEPDDVPAAVKDARQKLERADVAARNAYGRATKAANDAHVVECRLAMKKAMANGDLETANKIDAYLKSLAQPATAPASQPAAATPTPVEEWPLVKMSPRFVEVGYGPFSVATNGDVDDFDKPANSANGRTLDSIFAHAPSKLIYDIPEGATRFVTYARCRDTNRPNIVGVRVSADHTQLYENNGFSNRADASVRITVKLPPGSKRLVLEGFYTGDYHHEGHIWWEEAAFKVK